MRYAHIVALTLAWLSFTPTATAQQIWTVGPNGTFADLPPAVAAASAGDTILIESGYYSQTTVDKGLTLVGLAFPVAIIQVVISGVPANETVKLRDLGATFFPGSPSPVLLVEDCEGLVLLERVSVQGINGVHAEIANSDHVVLRNCNLIAFDQPHSITNSTVIADDSEFSAHPGFFSPNREILTLIDSEVTLTNCHLDSFQTMPAQHAFRLTQSTLRLVATTWDLPGSTANVDAVGDCPGASQVLLPANPPTTATPTLSGCITTANAELPSLSIDDLALGSPATLRIYADANTTAFVFAGLPASTTAPTSLGLLALVPQSSALLLTAAIPAQGIQSVALPPIPPQIAPGTTFGLQAAVASSQGLQLSAPTMATVR